jgi:hypothetical protein
MRTLLLAITAALLLSACGSDEHTGGGTPVDAQKSKWCENFKRIENSTHAIELAQVQADSTDPSLSAEERAAAVERYNEISSGEANTQPYSSCFGPVWNRYYAEKKAPKMSPSRNSSAQTTTSPPAPPTEMQLYLDAASRVGLTLTKTDYTNDKRHCDEFRKGSVPDSNGDLSRPAEQTLAEYEQVGDPNSNIGKRRIVSIDVLCPDLRPALDAALSGNYPRVYSSGKYLIEYSTPQKRGTVPPGTYQTSRSRVADCYWEISDSEGNILDNNFISVAPSITVTVPASASGFTSRNCGTWRYIN